MLSLLSLNHDLVTILDIYSLRRMCDGTAVKGVELVRVESGGDVTDASSG